MRKPFFFTLLALALAAPAAAQRLWIKPYYGYLKVSMTDLNNRVEDQILGWRDVLDAPVADPGKIDGNSAYGGEIALDFSDTYSAGIGIYYFKENISTRYTNLTGTALTQFAFERGVRLYDLFFNLRYYFSEPAFSPVSFYAGFGAGLAMAKASSNTQHFVSDASDTTFFVFTDTQGDFSGTTTSAQLMAGIEGRLGGFFLLWGEAGYQVARPGQMDGTIRRIGNEQGSAFTSNTSFNYSGFYARGGLGIALPLLK
jgi:hypothetical protein